MLPKTKRDTREGYRIRRSIKGVGYVAGVTRNVTPKDRFAVNEPYFDGSAIKEASRLKGATKQKGIPVRGIPFCLVELA